MATQMIQNSQFISNASYTISIEKILKFFLLNKILWVFESKDTIVLNFLRIKTPLFINFRSQFNFSKELEYFI